MDVTLRIWSTGDGILRREGNGYQAAVVPMEPFGKARPRVTVHGTYMPDTYQRARAVLRAAFGTVSVRPPWVVRVTATRRIPASWSRRRKAGMVGRWCETKPDIDNIVAGVMDAIFDEDAAVVAVSGRKVWGDAASLEIEVWTAGDDPATGVRPDTFTGGNHV